MKNRQKTCKQRCCSTTSTNVRTYVGCSYNYNLNEETNNRRIAFIDIKIEKSEYACGFDLKCGCFAKENFTLIISYYKI